eukprot:scaffold25918_cov45-Cyclotella_meneghiniana.AAC.1
MTSKSSYITIDSNSFSCCENFPEEDTTNVIYQWSVRPFPIDGSKGVYSRKTIESIKKSNTFKSHHKTFKYGMSASIGQSMEKNSRKSKNIMTGQLMTKILQVPDKTARLFEACLQHIARIWCVKYFGEYAEGPLQDMMMPIQRIAELLQNGEVYSSDSCQYSLMKTVIDNRTKLENTNFSKTEGGNVLYWMDRGASPEEIEEEMTNVSQFGSSYPISYNMIKVGSTKAKCQHWVLNPTRRLVNLRDDLAAENVRTRFTECPNAEEMETEVFKHFRDKRFTNGLFTGEWLRQVPGISDGAAIEKFVLDKLDDMYGDDGYPDYNFDFVTKLVIDDEEMMTLINKSKHVTDQKLWQNKEFRTCGLPKLQLCYISYSSTEVEKMARNELEEKFGISAQEKVNWMDERQKGGVIVGWEKEEYLIRNFLRRLHNIRDTLKGDDVNEIRVDLKEVIADGAGDDYKEE